MSKFLDSLIQSHEMRFPGNQGDPKAIEESQHRLMEAFRIERQRPGEPDRTQEYMDKLASLGVFGCQE